MLENFMLERKIKKAEKAMIDFLTEKDMKPESAYHYGAIEIDPKHLAIHLMYQTTEGMDKAYATEGLIEQCFSFLKEAGYPKGKEEGVHIGFESIQKIQEEANGNWYHYFK